MDSNALGLKFGVLQKQTLVATSTMETVFVFCFEDSSHGVWCKSFISRLRVVDSISRPLKLYCVTQLWCLWLRITRAEVEPSILTLNT